MLQGSRESGGHLPPESRLQGLQWSKVEGVATLKRLQLALAWSPCCAGWFGRCTRFSEVTRIKVELLP